MELVWSADKIRGARDDRPESLMMSSQLHPLWQNLIEWLNTRGMHSESLLVEARLTPGSYLLYPTPVQEIHISRCWLWIVCPQIDLSVCGTVHRSCKRIA